MRKDAKKHRKCWTNFKGLWIPYEIMVLQELSPTETVVLSLIHSYDNSAKPDGAPCYLDNLDLTEMLNVSKRTVINAVNRLKELGFIEVYIDQSIGNSRFLYSQMVIDPKGRGKRGGSAKITPPPKAKIAPAAVQKLHTPGAKSAPAYNKEVNTGSTEIETGFPLPPEDFYSPRSKEGLAVVAYRTAVCEARAMSAEFLTFFHDVIFKRFNKWQLNSTDLEDWYEYVWQKYKPIPIAEVIKAHRNDLPSKVWKPDMKQVRTLLRRNKERAETKAAVETARAAAETRTPPVGMYDDWIKLADKPAAFLEKYETDKFFRAVVDKKPELKAALERAQAATTEAVA